jgi:hypothetical protein
VINQDSAFAVTDLSANEFELVSAAGILDKAAAVVAVAEEGYEFVKGFVAGFEAGSK